MRGFSPPRVSGQQQELASWIRRHCGTHLTARVEETREPEKLLPTSCTCGHAQGIGEPPHLAKVDVIPAAPRTAELRRTMLLGPNTRRRPNPHQKCSVVPQLRESCCIASSPPKRCNWRPRRRRRARSVGLHHQKRSVARKRLWQPPACLLAPLESSPLARTPSPLRAVRIRQRHALIRTVLGAMRGLPAAAAEARGAWLATFAPDNGASGRCTPTDATCAILKALTGFSESDELRAVGGEKRGGPLLGARNRRPGWAADRQAREGAPPPASGWQLKALHCAKEGNAHTQQQKSGAAAARAWGERVSHTSPLNSSTAAMHASLQCLARAPCSISTGRSAPSAQRAACAHSVQPSRGKKDSAWQGLASAGRPTRISDSRVQRFQPARAAAAPGGGEPDISQANEIANQDLLIDQLLAARNDDEFARLVAEKCVR